LGEPGEHLTEPPLLDARQVLEHPAERHRRRSESLVQLPGGESLRLAQQRGAEVVDEPEQGRALVTGPRRIGPRDRHRSAPLPSPTGAQSWPHPSAASGSSACPAGRWSTPAAGSTTTSSPST